MGQPSQWVLIDHQSPSFPGLQCWECLGGHHEIQGDNVKEMKCCDHLRGYLGPQGAVVDWEDMEKETFQVQIRHLVH